MRAAILVMGASSSLAIVMVETDFDESNGE